MRFLITGAMGQLGQAFKTLFNDLSVDCMIADINQLDEDVFHLDITKLKEVRDFLREDPVDCIINCAAYNDVDNAETDWRTAYLVNGIGTRNLAIVSNEIGASIVHYSTDYVFDGTKSSPYTIADTPRPISKYGESKLLGETLLQQTALNYYLIRVSWLFGNGPVNFPTKVINWSSDRKELKIVDDQTSCPTFTDDVARATYDLITSRAFGLFHVTNSGYCSRYEWAKFILDQAGWEGELHPAKSSDFNTAAKRPRFSALDNFGSEEAIDGKLQHWKDATSQFMKQKGMI